MDELSSAEEDSLDSPQSPLSSGTLTLTPSAAQMITLPTCVQKITAENKINSENCIQKHKKPNDDRPKMKKLKYHEYVPPDQKGDKEAPPKLDSSYAKLLQQQQLFLHLQILSQQQQSQTHQQNKTDQEQLRPSSVDAPSASAHKAPAEESFKQEGLPQNLDELKVAELKAALKLRGLPVSGTKSDLMERLRVHQAGGSGRDSTRAQSPGGAIELGAEGATKMSRAAANGHLSPAIKPHTSTFQRKKCDNNSSRCELNSLENTSIVTEPKEGTTEMLDHRPAPPPRLCSIKEEQRSPIPVSLYIQKCRLVCPATSNLPTRQKSPALLADKDSMLRQKDRQIEELKRLLLHNQHLVDMLNIKLEKRKRQEQKMELLRVVPPDKNNQCSKTPFSTGEIAVKVKQEILSDDYKETGPQLESKLTDGNTGQHGRHLQAVHRLLLQQQRRLNRQQQLVIPRENRSAEHKQKKVCQEKKMKTLQRQQSTELDSKQILQRQERRLKGCQRIQVLTQRDLELQSTQISPVCPEKKLSHMPALVTDGNGNHFLISLKNSVTESQTHGDTPKPITSQFQSSPSDVPGHSSAQLPAADNEDRAIMHMGGLTQQSTKAECAGLQQHFTERLCESDNSDTSGHSQEICTGLDWIFSPLSSTTTSPDPKDPLHEDFIDIILKTGDISRFKPTPDPSLDDLHHSPPSPPMLLSPTVASCFDPAKPAPSAPHTSPGRLEDFLESTTGRPLLGVEPGGPLTLIDDLHSQMLCTPSILDHPSSPMDIERAVDTVDWFYMTMEDNYGKDLKLAPTSPPAVFSADFLDTYDLETAWDSCL
uniref:SAP domain-containing protein n=1 Tax=Knipowitschia caucasica TaxID=637954 RepID=A0AAV2KG33_KNICA